MVRLTSWIALCLCLALCVACSGVRTGGACAPACGPVETACAPVSDAGPDDQCGPRPAEAKAGEAWCCIWVPPMHETREKRVLVRPASQRKIQVPAEYGTRPKLVCVSPAKLKEVEKPGVWAHTKDDVLVRDGRTVYRKVKCDNDPSGECYKLEKCPPEFEARCKAVCVTPPKRCVEYSPAKYKLVDERFELRPAYCRTECVPAQYEMRTETVCVQPGRWEWRRNDACEVPVEPEQTLPALEVEMVDSNEAGDPEGVFEVGEIVRYDLTVRSDVGSEAFPTLMVQFTLPEQLEYVSGGGKDVTITGSGLSATSSVFKLSLDQEVKMHIMARVMSVPATPFVQTMASIRLESGEELTNETESTSLTTKGGK